MPTPLAPPGEKRERVVFGDETKLVELPEGHSLAKPDYEGHEPDMPDEKSIRAKIHCSE